MTEITLIQYLRPDGRQRPITFSANDYTARTMAEAREQHFEYSCEVLTDQKVAFYITDEYLERDIVCRVFLQSPELASLIIYEIDVWPVARLLGTRPPEYQPGV